MITVHFHGKLKAAVKIDKHEIDVLSPLEAVKFLEAVLPNFKHEFRAGAYMLAFAKQAAPLVGSLVNIAFGKRKELHILPLAAGAKIGATGAGIAPEANAYEDREENLSALFSGAVNTTEQGVCRPLIYGRVRNAGSAVISAGITSEQVPYVAQDDDYAVDYE